MRGEQDYCRTLTIHYCSCQPPFNKVEFIPGRYVEFVTPPGTWIRRRYEPAFLCRKHASINFGHIWNYFGTTVLISIKHRLWLLLDKKTNVQRACPASVVGNEFPDIKLQPWNLGPSLEDLATSVKPPVAATKGVYRVRLISLASR